MAARKFTNLGNALGARLGGVVITSGPGLSAATWVAALVTLAGLILALLGVREQHLQNTIGAQ